VVGVVIGLIGGVVIAWRVLRQRRELLATDLSSVDESAERP